MNIELKNSVFLGSSGSGRNYVILTTILSLVNEINSIVISESDDSFNFIATKLSQEGINASVKNLKNIDLEPKTLVITNSESEARILLENDKVFVWYKASDLTTFIKQFPQKIIGYLSEADRLNALEILSIDTSKFMLHKANGHGTSYLIENDQKQEFIKLNVDREIFSKYSEV